MNKFFGGQRDWNFTDWGTLASKTRSLSSAVGLLIGAIVVTFGYTVVSAIFALWFKRNIFEFIVLAFIHYGLFIYGIYFIGAYLLFALRRRRLQPLLGRVYTIEQMQKMAHDIKYSGLDLNPDEERLLEGLNNQALTVSSHKKLKQLLSKVKSE